MTGSGWDAGSEQRQAALGSTTSRRMHQKRPCAHPPARASPSVPFHANNASPIAAGPRL